MDKGPWITRIFRDHDGVERITVNSEDFSRDVVLYVTGDFADNDERRRYCEWLRDTLNKATANSTPTE